MTPEGAEKVVIKKYLEEIGAYHFWPVQTGYGRATLDCIGCDQGYYFSIEVKSERGRMNDRQRFIMAEMQKAGAHVFVGTAAKVIREFQQWRTTRNS